MSAAPLTSAICPHCNQPWFDIGSVVITGAVPAQLDAEGKARIGVLLGCDECETQYEAWIALEAFEEVRHDD